MRSIKHVCQQFPAKWMQAVDERRPRVAELNKQQRLTRAAWISCCTQGWQQIRTLYMYVYTFASRKLQSDVDGEQTSEVTLHALISLLIDLRYYGRIPQPGLKQNGGSCLRQNLYQNAGPQDLQKHHLRSQ